MTAPIPRKIEPYSATEMLLEWSSGERFSVPYFELRFECPCANCVDEHTGRRMLRREQVKSDVAPTGAHPVGRYAIQIQWNDGHSTGMYHFESLHQICERTGKKLV